MRKILFTMRVDPEVVDRLKSLVRRRELNTNDVLSLALDALEREQKEGYSLPERVTYLEKNVAAFFELVMTFTEKLEAQFSQANLYEKERLKSLYQLFKEQMAQADQAQEARFEKFLGPNREGNP